MPGRATTKGCIKRRPIVIKHGINEWNPPIMGITSTSFLQPPVSKPPGIPFEYYTYWSVCGHNQTIQIPVEDFNRAISIASETSSHFTAHVPYEDLCSWLDGLDQLQVLQVTEGSCSECLLIRLLYESVGLPLLVSAMHTNDMHMMNELFRVYDNIADCSEYARDWASTVIQSRSLEEM